MAAITEARVREENVLKVLRGRGFIARDGTVSIIDNWDIEP